MQRPGMYIVGMIVIISVLVSVIVYLMWRSDWGNVVEPCIEGVILEVKLTQPDGLGPYNIPKTVLYFQDGRIEVFDFLQRTVPTGVPVVVHIIRNSWRETRIIKRIELLPESQRR